MKSIDQILRKRKNWTGDEVGRAVIASLAFNFDEVKSGRENKTLFTQELLDKMLASIEDRPAELERYNRYVQLNNWIIRNQPIAIAYRDHITSEIQHRSRYLAVARATEEAYQLISTLPQIMTEKEYEDAVANAIEDEDIVINIFQLLQYALSELLLDLAENPKAANPLKAIRRKYQKEPLTSRYILDRYNEVNNKGYCTLEDGRRSDRMTEEEWLEATQTPKMKEALSAIKENRRFDFFGDGREITAAEYAHEMQINIAYNIFNGGTEKTADIAYGEEAYKAGLAPVVIWNIDPEPPVGLTKWQIIESANLAFYYHALLEKTTPEEYDAEVKDFLADFEELAKAVLNDIDKRYFKGKSKNKPEPASGTLDADGGLSSLPFEQWKETTFTAKSLIDAGFYNMRELFIDSRIFFGAGERAKNIGVAVLKMPCYRKRTPFNIDSYIDQKTGYYKDPTQNAFSLIGEVCGLESLTPASEKYSENTARLEEGREQILDLFYWITGYNIALQLIAEETVLPQIITFKVDVEDTAKEIKSLNADAALLYMDMTRTEHKGAEEITEQKLAALQEYFKPIETNDLKPSETDIEKAKAMLADNLEAFRWQDTRFLDLLTYREQGIGEGEL